MQLQDRIHALTQLGDRVKQSDVDLTRAVFAKAIIDNPWFTESGIEQALEGIVSEFLNGSRLTEWAEAYTIDNSSPKIVGLVLAGNIPLVGFHDVLCVFIAGHKSLIKYSHKDKVLLQWMIKLLKEIDPRTEEYFIEVEQLKGMDAVIATGGATAATHFNYYFSKYPHIIRRNRSSVAVLNSEDSDDMIKALGKDIFTYFGLGCRSISKIYLPEGFNTDRVFENIIDYADVIHHNKYKNNFDYSHALYILAQQPFLTNNFLILKEDAALSSRISCLHYEWYDSLDSVQVDLESRREDLQCVSSNLTINGFAIVPLGQCQQPKLEDYADHIDTLDFLIELND